MTAPALVVSLNLAAHCRHRREYPGLQERRRVPTGVQAELRLPQLIRYVPGGRLCNSLLGEACPGIGQMPAPERFNQSKSKRATRKDPGLDVGRILRTGVAKEQLA